MRYDEQDRESTNVEDRRGERGGFGFPGGRGGGIQIPIGGKGGFSLTTLLILGAIMLLFGINPLEVLLDGGTRDRQSAGEEAAQGRRPAERPGAENAMASFVKKVLADTEDVWGREFKRFNRTYQEPELVMFSGATRTACGTGVSQMGPFYCPLDQKVYIDLAFYDELKRRFNAPGDFAQAYVIAHEVGHHVQTLLGIAEKVQEMKQRMSDVEANALQVRMELQADCLSGVWANLNHQLKNRLEEGDIEEGLNAASQIGDDMIQRRTQGHVVPDAFTHGSAKQRVRWFKTGFQSGEMQLCDTFNTDDL
jgi:predicted metalloprotease